jgi:hypothetical protein
MPYGYSLGLKALTAVSGDPVAFDAIFQNYIDSFKDTASPILQVIVGDFVFN